VHWLAVLLLPESTLDFDDIVAMNAEVLSEEFVQDTLVDHYVSSGPLHSDLSRILEVVELTGAITWSGRVENQDLIGDRYYTGGTVILTAFGRRVLPDQLKATGVRLLDIGDVAEADMDRLVDIMSSAPPEQHSALLDAWRPQLPESERAGMLVQVLASGETTEHRLMAVHMLSLFDPAVTEPQVRRLLDTDARGHAALWLVDNDLATPDEMAQYLTPVALVDLLYQLLDDPQALCEQCDDIPAHHEFIEAIWRTAIPETAVVLDALGKHLPDKTLAKQARKAAIKHRSFMANGGRV